MRDGLLQTRTPDSTAMLVLFETPAGYALFKVNDKGVLKEDANNIASHFKTSESATSL